MTATIEAQQAKAAAFAVAASVLAAHPSTDASFNIGWSGQLSIHLGGGDRAALTAVGDQLGLDPETVKQVEHQGVTSEHVEREGRVLGVPVRLVIVVHIAQDGGAS